MFKYLQNLMDNKAKRKARHPKVAILLIHFKKSNACSVKCQKTFYKRSQYPLDRDINLWQ